MRKMALLRYLKPVTPMPQQEATELPAPASNRSTATPSRKTRGEYTRLTPSEKAHEKLNQRKIEPTKIKTCRVLDQSMKFQIHRN